jgi:hypothetical protein
MKQIFLHFLIIFAFGIATANAQRPRRCPPPNATERADIKITPEGDIDVYPCPGRNLLLRGAPFGGGGGGGEVNTASNVGTGVGVFKDKSGVDLRFKSLIPGSATAGIAISGGTNEVSVSVVRSPDAGNSLELRANGLYVPPIGGGGGSGTVTSVGLSLPSIFNVSGSPVTASGSLTATLASQTQNQFLGAPDGSNGTPTFRALTTNDIPSLSAAKITTGVFNPDRLASGVRDGTKFLRDDGTWQIVPSSGGSGAATSFNSVTALPGTCTASAVAFRSTDGKFFGCTADNAPSQFFTANELIGGANIANNAVGNAQFRQSAGLSIVGVSGNATANVGDITAANDGEVLRRAGTTLGFGTLGTTSFANNSVTYGKMQTGTANRLFGTNGSGAFGETTVSNAFSVSASQLSLNATDCSNATTSKVLFNATTQTISCGTDQTGGGGGSSITIADEGSTFLTPVTSLNFVGSNVVVSEATSGNFTVTVSGSGAAADETVFSEKDDFSFSPGSELPWTYYSTSGSGSEDYATSEANRLGIRTITTGAAAGNDRVMLDQEDLAARMRFQDLVGMQLTWIFRLSAGTQTGAVVGFRNFLAGQYSPTDGCFARVNSGAAATNWEAVCRQGGTAETATSLGVLSSTGWNKLKMTVNSTTSVSFQMNGGSLVNITTNIPAATANVFKSLQIITNNAAEKTAFIDYYRLHGTVSR